jgi:hypothetical protein
MQALIRRNLNLVLRQSLTHRPLWVISGKIPGTSKTQAHMCAQRIRNSNRPIELNCYVVREHSVIKIEFRIRDGELGSAAVDHPKS